jgi:hypothetical protein
MARRQTDDPPLTADTRPAKRPQRPTLEASPPIARRRVKKGADWGLIGVLAALGVAATGLVYFGAERYYASRGAPLGPQSIAARPDTVVPGQAPLPPPAEAAGTVVPLPSGLATLPPGTSIAPPPASSATAPTPAVAGKAPPPPSVPYSPAGGGLMMGSETAAARDVGVAPVPKATPGGSGPAQVTNDVELLKPKALGTLKVPTPPKAP